jgi:hypothetical protein
LGPLFVSSPPSRAMSRVRSQQQESLGLGLRLDLSMKVGRFERKIYSAFVMVVFQVAEIMNSGPCQNSCLRVDDEITHINRIILTGQDINDAKAIIKGQISKSPEVTLTVKRGPSLLRYIYLIKPIILNYTPFLPQEVILRSKFISPLIEISPSDLWASVI